ncbi:hypothetical protein JAO73_22695 [Hymenobacter sp. BT523]|uniref:hypothetical protein n=1 Tax=Hymenobacter sp. BT523 TaxID=2795725 RepID=UPI0018EC9E7E|nr:hypothetical protein [Hymenobacter sp. BT523]MBJ6111846.1 hypothetical protein [Hymenobacter sp. BT523]
MTQVATLEDLYSTANPLASGLADEMVTADPLQLLHDRTAAYKLLVGTPRQQSANGSVLREAAGRHLGEARAGLDWLDVRVPNLKSARPDLVAEHFKVRTVVDAGRGGKPTGGTPSPAM